MPNTDLGKPIRDFFEQHLIAQRGLSGHTVLAYRDALKLFLEFTARDRHKACSALTLEDLTADTLRRFLVDLEKTRQNAVPTRNLRLAAIHAFFQYLAATDPRHLHHCQSILGVPFKRQAHRVPDYLEHQEVQAFFARLDSRTRLGRRDEALLRLLYNTGLRAQELVDLDVNQVRFTRPYSVRIRGKGRRERTCPLWPETISALKRYLEPRSLNFSDAVPLFLNAEGNRLTRFGLRHLIARRAAEAAQSCPSLLGRRITPHTWRHTTALHLLQSGVDLTMIRSWLGHASIQTTSNYVEIDLEMKRKTLKSCEKLLPKAHQRGAAWRRNEDLISWLSKL